MTDVSAELPPVRPAGWHRLLALSPMLADFDRRGFRTGPRPVRTELELSAKTFLHGFNVQLATPPGRAPDLGDVAELRRGFAVEGAAMAAAMLDRMRAGQARRFPALRDRYDGTHAYLLWVGAGWAMAKLRRRRLGSVGPVEPLLHWLAYDGAGFCQGFFASPRALRRFDAPHPTGCDATCHIRYQGLGRSLWFRECGTPDAVADRIARLPATHQGDAWSGIALAATYAGGAPTDAYDRLRELADRNGADAAQGAAFGAEAWRLCGYAPPHADAAVLALAGVDLDRAAGWTWDARRGLGGDAGDYQMWRRRIQQRAAEATYR